MLLPFQRELAEAKAKEEMKIKEKERLEKTKKEEEERLARKKVNDVTWQKKTLPSYIKMMQYKML